MALILISGFTVCAFADEIEPFDYPGVNSYENEISNESGGEEESETSSYGNSGFESRDEAVRFSNICFGFAVMVSCAGWAALIAVNKKKKKSRTEKGRDEVKVVL